MKTDTEVKLFLGGLALVTLVAMKGPGLRDRYQDRRFKKQLGKVQERLREYRRKNPR